MMESSTAEFLIAVTALFAQVPNYEMKCGEEVATTAGLERRSSRVLRQTRLGAEKQCGE